MENPQDNSTLILKGNPDDPSLIPPKKRMRLSFLEGENNEHKEAQSQDASKSVSSDSGLYCLHSMEFIDILRCDNLGKSLVLHTRLADKSANDAIVILQKSAFPKTVSELCESGIILASSSSTKKGDKDPDHIPNNLWKCKQLTDNDVFHRFSVQQGLENVNSVDMTVIYPAQPHHFSRFSSSYRIIHDETPEEYHSLVIPFLGQRPKDLAWVDNILLGKAETDRIIFSDQDPNIGFTLVLDFRWDGRFLQSMHILGLVPHPGLTCLRDLRSEHIPLLKRMLCEGRSRIIDHYAKVRPVMEQESVNDEASPKPAVPPNQGLSRTGESALKENQILAYFHYPPTFYRLHVHYAHVDAACEHGTRVGRAHLLYDVIQNLELDGDYYAKRIIPVYLQTDGDMLKALQNGSSHSEHIVPSTEVTDQTK